MLPVPERKTSDLFMQLVRAAFAAGGTLSPTERREIADEIDRRCPPLPGTVARAVHDDDERRRREKEEGSDA